MKEITILGKTWTIAERSETEDERLRNCDGLCDWTTREIVVEREMKGTLRDMEKYIKKVTRHEIVHAFLFESGLAECSHTSEAWAKNEEMIDYFAKLGPQIVQAWKSAGAM